MTSEFVFFWNGIFSNWAKTPFTYKGVKFTTSEQAMMWEKAMCFDDVLIAEKILKTSNPREQKYLGRQVRNYDDAVWAKVRYEIVVEILKQKFSQVVEAREALLATGDKEIVEASPEDTIWGYRSCRG